MSREDAYRPIIVLGAARSGTRLLRAVIAAHPDVVAIPYDINYVWRHGNYRFPHDELTPDELTPAIRKYIRRFFGRWRRKARTGHVVEKTVSNTLRVPFVRAVFPDCLFVHLIRDGRDVAASARRMWQAPVDWRATLRKLRNFPLRALPSYGLDYVRYNLHRSFVPGQCVKSWGPRFSGIDAVAEQRSLLATCGIQWRRSVESTLRGLESIPERDQVEVRYEQLVRDPVPAVAQLLGRLDLDLSEEAHRTLASSVSPANIGKWRRELDQAELQELMAEIADTLSKLGYQG